MLKKQEDPMEIYNKTSKNDKEYNGTKNYSK